MVCLVNCHSLYYTEIPINTSKPYCDSHPIKTKKQTRINECYFRTTPIIQISDRLISSWQRHKGEDVLLKVPQRMLILKLLSAAFNLSKMPILWWQSNSLFITELKMNDTVVCVRYFSDK